MFSLLNPVAQEAPWPLSLELPNEFGNAWVVVQKNIATNLDVVPLSSGQKMLFEAKKGSEELEHKSNFQNYHEECGNEEMYEQDEPRKSRKKMAWACPHKSRFHYAKGKCQLCYLKQYNRKRASRRSQNASNSNT